MSTYATAAEFDRADDNDQTREIFALFGAALYSAQVLEHGLVNLMYVANALSGRIPSVAEVDRFFEKSFRRTLGQLATQLRSSLDVDDDIELVIRDAVSRRNVLAHSFFRNRAEQFVSRGGRAAMRQELLQDADFFREVDERVSGLTFDIGAAIGLTPARVQDAVHQMIRQS